jgi:hypothetical protein
VKLTITVRMLMTSGPESESDDGGDGTDENGFHQDTSGHLGGTGTEGAQQGKLALPLGHQDVEGVEDEEGADEQCYSGEHEEQRGEEAEAALDGRCRLGRHLGTGGELDGGGQYLREPALQLFGRDSRVSRDPDGVVLPGMSQEPFRFGLGERHDARSTEVVVRPQPDGAAQDDVLPAAGEQDGHVVTDPESGLASGADVQGDLPGA